MQSAHYLFSIKKSVVSRKKCKTDLHPWLRAGQEGEALAAFREQGETGVARWGWIAFVLAKLQALPLLDLLAAMGADQFCISFGKRHSF